MLVSGYRLIYAAVGAYICRAETAWRTFQATGYLGRSVADVLVLYARASAYVGGYVAIFQAQPPCLFSDFGRCLNRAAYFIKRVV